MAQPDAMAEEVRNDWLPLQSAEPGGGLAPALLTISVEMIRFAAGALRASVTSTDASNGRWKRGDTPECKDSVKMTRIGYNILMIDWPLQGRAS